MLPAGGSGMHPLLMAPAPSLQRDGVRVGSWPRQRVCREPGASLSTAPRGCSILAGGLSPRGAGLGAWGWGQAGGWSRQKPQAAHARKGTRHHQRSDSFCKCAQGKGRQLNLKGQGCSAEMLSGAGSGGRSRGTCLSHRGGGS